MSADKPETPEPDAEEIRALDLLIEERLDLKATIEELRAKLSSAERRAEEAEAELSEAEKKLQRVLAVAQPCLTGRVYTDAEDAVRQVAQVAICEQDNSRELEAKLEQAERERDEARKIVAGVNNSVFGSEGYFTEPSCVEQVEKVKAYSGARYREAESQRSLVATLVEALRHYQREGVTVRSYEFGRAALSQAQEHGAGAKDQGR